MKTGRRTHEEACILMHEIEQRAKKRKLAEKQRRKHEATKNLR